MTGKKPNGVHRMTKEERWLIVAATTLSISIVRNTMLWTIVSLFPNIFNISIHFLFDHRLDCGLYCI